MTVAPSRISNNVDIRLTFVLRHWREVAQWAFGPSGGEKIPKIIFSLSEIFLGLETSMVNNQNPDMTLVSPKCSNFRFFRHR